MRSLTRAFPAALADDVLGVSDLVRLGYGEFDTYPARVSVGGEDLAIPYRVAGVDPPPHVTHRRRLILTCLATRDLDGVRREDACRRIISSREPWVVPFVLRLLGEYVDEISRMILHELEARAAFTSVEYVEFVRANDRFLALTEQRAASYWGCNHRGDYRWKSSPALATLERLRQGASSSAASH